MLPKLETLDAYNCKGLVRIKKEKDQVWETMSSDVTRVVDFSFCRLSDDFLATLFPCLYCFTKLSIDYSSITILPTCINVCHSLKEVWIIVQSFKKSEACHVTLILIMTASYAKVTLVLILATICVVILNIIIIVQISFMTF
jgi:hypothetical protein